jgi:hypothetical protein
VCEGERSFCFRYAEGRPIYGSTSDKSALDAFAEPPVPAMVKYNLPEVSVSMSGFLALTVELA